MKTTGSWNSINWNLFPFLLPQFLIYQIWTHFICLYLPLGLTEGEKRENKWACGLDSNIHKMNLQWYNNDYFSDYPDEGWRWKGRKAGRDDWVRTKGPLHLCKPSDKQPWIWEHMLMCLGCLSERPWTGQPPEGRRQQHVSSIYWPTHT